MDYHQEQDGSISVTNYRVGLIKDVVIGRLRKGGEDEDYWHFYPSEQCVLNAGACIRLSMKLSELNERHANAGMRQKRQKKR